MGAESFEIQRQIELRVDSSVVGAEWLEIKRKRERESGWFCFGCCRGLRKYSYIGILQRKAARFRAKHTRPYSTEKKSFAFQEFDRVCWTVVQNFKALILTY